MGNTIVVLNQKGGVAKTTSVFNLAAAKAASGNRLILMIDMDQQGSLTECCGMYPDDIGFNDKSSCDLFDRKADPFESCFLVSSTKLDNLFIIPSSQKLIFTASSLYNGPDGINTFRTQIKKLATRFDYIFCDCAPGIDRIALSILLAADKVIIPVKPEKMSYFGLDLIEKTINSVKEPKPDIPANPNIEVLGAICTMYRSNVTEHKEYQDLIHNRINVLGTIPLSAMVSKDIEKGLPVVLAHPTSVPAKVYVDIANMIKGG